MCRNIKTRRNELERIIIGSLMADFYEYYPACQYCVTQEMFDDKMMRRLYGCMIRLHQDGTEVNISTIVESMNIVIGEIVSYLCGIAAFESFLHKKTEYNMNQELFNKNPRFTNVTFDDYVRRFIKMANS